MILLDLINLQKIRRAILYGFCILALLWLQLSVFSRFTLPGGVKPFFIPVAVTAVALWEGGVWGGVAGLLAGLYCDLNMVSSTVTFLILFAVLGFFAGVLADYFINRRFVAYLLMTAFALLLTVLVQSMPPLVFHGASLRGLLPVIVLQTLWSWPFAVPVYFVTKLISGRSRTDTE